MIANCNDALATNLLWSPIVIILHRRNSLKSQNAPRKTMGGKLFCYNWRSNFFLLMWTYALPFTFRRIGVNVELILKSQLVWSPIVTNIFCKFICFSYFSQRPKRVNFIKKSKHYHCPYKESFTHSEIRRYKVPGIPWQNDHGIVSGGKKQ